MRMVWKSFGGFGAVKSAMQDTYHISPEYEALLPKLSREEFAALKQSIKENGLFYPIVVNAEKTVLDGHHRLKACEELGIVPDFQVERKFEGDPLGEKEFVVEANLRRRHLNDFQRAELGVVFLEVAKERAKQRQGTRTDLGQTLSPNGEDVGVATEIVAKKIGLSPRTFQRSLTIIEQAPEEIKDKVRKGETSINFAYEQVKNREEIVAPPLPEGEYDVVLADPPWKYDLPLRGSPDMHYKTLSTEQLCALKVPAAKNALLFLWATNPKLEDAFKVLNAWGFSYKTNLVWVKDRFGTGYYVRGQHELLLIARKGAMPPPIEENRVSSVLHSPRREHSQKPVEVYATIEKMYPNGKKLELFATNKREGWASWGCEVA